MDATERRVPGLGRMTSEVDEDGADEWRPPAHEAEASERVAPRLAGGAVGWC
jgi:hypothetical protein